jgi:peroxiredoxin Q/BCP
MLKTGDQAPDFDAVDDRGKRRRLSDFAGKRLLLWFYPKSDTPG